MQQLLAADFYGWQSGARRAAATAGEADRTLLGGKSGGSGRKNARGVSSAAAEGIGYSREGGADAVATGPEEGGGRWRGRSDANVSANRNPVLGGFQRLRNVRGADGDWARRGEVAAAAAAAGETTAATLQTSRDASGSAAGKGFPESAAAPSAPSRGVSGDDFDFEVSLDVKEGQRGYETGEKEEEGGAERRQQGWRRGWMGGGNQDADSGGGGGGSGGGGGGGGSGSINWWG